MPSKQKRKHDPKKRLRANMLGSRIIFDGNDRNQLDYRQSNGLLMTRDMLDIAVGLSWRWDITLGLICHQGGKTRNPEIELSINQPCRINDLTDYVKNMHEIMALEQPAAWKIVAQTWEAKIIG